MLVATSGPVTALARTQVMTISAQDLYNYTKCHHRVYLDSNGDPAERGEVSSFVEMLWEMGLQTERDYLADGEATNVADLSDLNMERALVKTRELMHQGQAAIYQGAIEAGDWRGRPDLLFRHDEASSTLGPFYYEAVDIKGGRGWEERHGKKTRFKSHYAFQILFYREILYRLQGYRPGIGRIVNVDHELEEFDPADFDDAFAAALADVTRLVNGSKTSEPVLGSACHQCHWYQRCRRWVEGTHDPSGLFFVGKVKFDLKRVGLQSIDDIARMNVKDYLEGASKIPRASEKTLLRLKERARVRLANQPHLRSGYSFPVVTKEIYFDIEDDPTQDFTYLYGLVERHATGASDFRYFLARHPNDEEQAVREFWQYLADNDDVVYYVYSAKERSSLRKLMQRYDLETQIFEHYCEQEYDLYTDLVVKYSDWPTYSYGIKQIAQIIGFRWRDADPSGANSIVWLNDYLADPTRTDVLQRILDYNEDDCYAMVAVKDYFAARLTQEKP